VGAVDAQRSEDGRRVTGPHRHRVGGRVVRLVAATQTPVVDVDGSELAGWQRPGNRRLTHVIDAVEQAAVQYDGDAGAP
jgi:hypothetical protein